MAKTKAIRGRIFHFIKDPFTTKEEESYEYFPDGLLLIQDGFIKKADHYSKLIDELETETEITHYENELIIPGFIDTHIHYPQTEMICSYGEQLI